MTCLNIAWVSTYNTKCGLATYSHHLLQNMNWPIKIFANQTDLKIYEDGPSVFRCWKPFTSDYYLLLQNILDHNITLVVLQYHCSMFPPGVLDQFIKWCKNVAYIKVVVMVHSMGNTLVDQSEILGMCDLVTVQNKPDLERVKHISPDCRVEIFPCGIYMTNLPLHQPDWDNPLLGSYGFFLPNKGLIELIIATAILRNNNFNFRLRMVNAAHPSAIGCEMIRLAQETIEKLSITDSVELHTEFLPEIEGLKLLSGCELIVNPYQQTAEPISGSVRSCLASGRPVVVTPNKIFDDIGDIVFRLSGFSIDSIAQGILDICMELKVGSPRSKQIITNAYNWSKVHDYRVLGPILLEKLFLVSVK
jgi:O-antigen biosynthesis alpha-1,2-mannosyltransferase